MSSNGPTWADATPREYCSLFRHLAMRAAPPNVVMAARTVTETPTTAAVGSLPDGLPNDPDEARVVTVTVTTGFGVADAYLVTVTVGVGCVPDAV